MSWHRCSVTVLVLLLHLDMYMNLFSERALIRAYWRQTVEALNRVGVSFMAYTVDAHHLQSNVSAILITPDGSTILHYTSKYFCIINVLYHVTNTAVLKNISGIIDL